MKQAPTYRVETFPASRQFTIDLGRLGQKKHYIRALIEVDVTDSRAKIRRLKSEKPGSVSFNSWLIKCLAQAVADHPQIHALKCGRNRRVIFGEVDISIMVEREVEGQSVPLPVVLRRTNERSIGDIQTEIAAAKSQTIGDEGDFVLGSGVGRQLMQGVLLLPRCIRLLGWKAILSNPVRVKQMMGTVIVSSVGTTGDMRGWAIPLTIHPLAVTLGSIVKRPGVFRDQPAIREYLPMTLSADHDVVDGMPAARFISRFTQLLENGFGLPE